MKKALITGVTGPNGAYLAELLLGKGYEVRSIKRRASLLDKLDGIPRKLLEVSCMNTPGWDAGLNAAYSIAMDHFDHPTLTISILQGYSCD